MPSFFGPVGGVVETAQVDAVGVRCPTDAVGQAVQLLRLPIRDAWIKPSCDLPERLFRRFKDPLIQRHLVLHGVEGGIEVPQVGFRDFR